jgi:hypothetical protein
VYKDVESVEFYDNENMDGDWFLGQFKIKIKDDYNYYYESCKNFIHVEDDKNYIIDLEPWLKCEYLIVHGSKDFVKNIVTPDYLQRYKSVNINDIKYWDAGAIIWLVLAIIVIALAIFCLDCMKDEW